MLDPSKKYIIHDISVELYNGMPLWPGNRHISQVKNGVYYYIGLPLNLKKSEGSPVRAVLLEIF